MKINIKTLRINIKTLRKKHPGWIWTAHQRGFGLWEYLGVNGTSTVIIYRRDGSWYIQEQMVAGETVQCGYYSWWACRNATPPHNL